MNRIIIALFLIGLLTPINILAQTNTPDTFRGSEGIDQNSIGDLKWFEVFKDQQLQQLVRTAMVQNYDLGLARSDQFPQFEVGADLTTNRFSSNGQLAGSGQAGERRSFGSVLVNLLTFEIDVWGRLRNQTDRKSTRLNSSHVSESRMPSSA